jgi:5-aminolevulinate synthase
MDYARKFRAALDAVHQEGRYRIFADVKRRCGAYPSAVHYAGSQTRSITVWCSNDYLGMGQHPAVIAAMHEAIDTVGAGSGGTRYMVVKHR